MIEDRTRIALAGASIGGLLLCWTLLSISGISSLFLPSPYAVLIEGTQMLVSGALIEHVVASMSRVLKGFAIGFCLAVPVGVLMGTSKFGRGLISPIIEISRPIPPIAIIPLAILWLGIGEASKVAIIAYGAFFPVLLNTVAGFTEVDDVLIRAAQTLGASRLQVFRDVVLRSAVPFIVVGARLGMSMAFIVLVAAELIASSKGLGFMINDARYNFRTERMFVGIVVIGLLGLCLNKLLVMAERRLLRWREA